MAAVTSPSKEEVRAVLLDHFSSAAQTEDPSLQNSRWHSLWESSFTPWDRGIPNPALEDLLSQRADLLGSPFTTATPTEQRRRKRALVPGCGRGYDVLLLASFGYDAYGLDVSASAVQLCETWAKEHGDEYKVRDDKVGRGQAKFIAADFFKDEWREELDGGGVDGFELIYDYTFLSALSPVLRPAWSLRYSQLLRSTTESCLVCVEFPSKKPPSTRGPPFGLPEKVYVCHLGHPGENLPYDDQDNLLEDKVSKIRSAKGLERVARWKPERTHEIGKGEDWLSVWRHPSS